MEKYRLQYQEGSKVLAVFIAPNSWVLPACGDCYIRAVKESTNTVKHNEAHQKRANTQYEIAMSLDEIASYIMKVGNEKTLGYVILKCLGIKLEDDKGKLINFKTPIVINTY